MGKTSDVGRTKRAGMIRYPAIALSKLALGLRNLEVPYQIKMKPTRQRNVSKSHPKFSMMYSFSHASMGYEPTVNFSDSYGSSFLFTGSPSTWYTVIHAETS